MHSEKAHPLLVGDHVGRDRAKKAFFRRAGVNDLTEKTLARGADEHGEAELNQGTDPIQECQVMLKGLTEADARVEDDVFLLYSRLPLEMLTARRARR